MYLWLPGMAGPAWKALEETPPRPPKEALGSIPQGQSRIEVLILMTRCFAWHFMIPSRGIQNNLIQGTF